MSSQTEKMNMQELRQQEARLYNGTDIVFLVCLQCHDQLVSLYINMVIEKDLFLFHKYGGG